MKRLLLAALLILGSLGIAAPALAFPTPCNAYCHVYNYPDGSYWVKLRAAEAKYKAAYDKVYCYPTGTYYIKQIAAFPDYYAAHNAQLLALYGPGTFYCP